MHSIRSIRRATSVLALAAAIAPVAAFAMAHTEMKPRLWWVHEERAKPNMIAQYEAASKDFTKMVSDNRKALPTLSYTAFQTRDFSYKFVVPIETMAGADTIFAGFEALAKAAPERQMDVARRGGAATESMADSIVEERPDLSYRPAQPRLKAEEAGYTNVDYYYLLPGREMEVDALAKEFAALWKAKGIQTPWTLYKAVTGDDLPMILVRTDAKDAADYYTQDAKDVAMAGAEGQALFQKAFAISRRVEHRSGMVRRDLSLAPMMSDPMMKK